MNLASPFVLSTERLRAAVPSAYATAPQIGVSDRYRFVPTSEVIDLFRSEGWAPVKASEQRVRLETRQGFQSHMIRFARTDDLAKRFEVRDVRPEMILRNSHDRTTAFRIDAGLYRLVCSNGLTVADTTFKSLSLRHVDVSNDAFLRGASDVLAATPKTIATVRQWQSVRLSEASRGEFAKRAMTLRWTEDDVPPGLEASALLTARRGDDRGQDLWTTFNLIQENLVKGVRYREGWARRKVRKIVSPAVDLSVNKGLWAIAEEFANN